MKDKINSILSEVKTKISEAANENELQNVKNAYVGNRCVKYVNEGDAEA